MRREKSAYLKLTCKVEVSSTLEVEFCWGKVGVKRVQNAHLLQSINTCLSVHCGTSSWINLIAFKITVCRDILRSKPEI